MTGLNSDYRIKLRTDAIEEFVLSLLNEFIVRKKISKYSPDTSVVNILNSYPLNDFIKKYNLESKIIKELVSDLTENQGASIITSGFKLPESTHIAVNLLNEVLGNSKLFSENNFREDLIPLSSKKDIDSLVSNIGSGKVGAVINFDSNQAFHFED